MRVTSNSSFGPFQRNLEEIQARKALNELRIASGKNIQNLSEDPVAVVQVKRLSSIIEQNQNYNDNLNLALRELYAVDESIRQMSDLLQSIRQITIDATSTGNSASTSGIAYSVKGFLESIVKDANVEFNGHFLFSGTATTPTSIDKSEAPDNNPFQIIKTTASQDNFSGYKVVYKGNNEDRIMNIDKQSTEVLNVQAKEMFGSDDSDVFESIVGIFNVLAYNPDGTQRGRLDFLTKADIDQLNTLQQKLGAAYEVMNNAASRNGTKITRFEAMNMQFIEENIRLKDLRSIKEDTDFAKAIMDLQRDNTALQYALQVGSRLIQNSLFDFLR